MSDVVFITIAAAALGGAIGGLVLWAAVCIRQTIQDRRELQWRAGHRPVAGAFSYEKLCRETGFAKHVFHRITFRDWRKLYPSELFEGEG